MSAVILEIVDAVAAALATATLSQSFVVERAYVPVHRRDDLDGLLLTVVPASIATTLVDRTPRHEHEYRVDIGIQQAVDPTNTNVDPLMLLAQEVMDLFRGRPLVGYEAAGCTGAANNPIYVPQHLDEERVFTSVVSLTFAVVR